MSKKHLQQLAFTLTVASLVSCSYRFSNLRAQNRHNIRSIFINQIFDSSSEVVPSQEMWLSMQRAFAKTSSVRLTNRQDADAILTVHLRQSSLSPTGTTVNNDSSFAEEEPKITSQNPASFKSFKFLNRAGEYSDKTLVNTQATVSIYSKTLKQKVFSQDYNLSEVFLSTETRGDLNSEYLNFEEKIHADFKNIAATLAERVVQDFIYGL